MAKPKKLDAFVVYCPRCAFLIAIKLTHLLRRGRRAKPQAQRYPGVLKRIK